MRRLTRIVPGGSPELAVPVVGSVTFGPHSLPTGPRFDGPTSVDTFPTRIVSTALLHEAARVLERFDEWYGAQSDGPLPKGMVNGMFLDAREIARSLRGLRPRVRVLANGGEVIE